MKPILEVIALNAADARAAQDGGADRIELVTAMDQAGLTPSIETFLQVKAVTDLPLRVMLRNQDGYGHSAGLAASAAALRLAGADEFVLGFLNGAGAVEMPDLAALEGCSWTFHRALDHAADRTAALAAIQGFAGVDCVLTAGSPDGVSAGLEVLLAEARAGATPRILAGGGLRREHVGPLAAAGVDAFHVGSGVRSEGWTSPVNPALVTQWRTLIDTA